jgi:hypothetical protein
MIQTDEKSGRPITLTLAVVSGKTTRSLSPSSLQNAEISTPRPLRPTPLAFSLLHQHRQWDWATSQTTEYIPLLHRRPQPQTWQASNRTLEQWASTTEGLNRTKQWEDQQRERSNQHPSHWHLDLWQRNRQAPLPSGSTPPTSSGQAAHHLGQGQEEDPGQEYNPPQQRLRRITERITL